MTGHDLSVRRIPYMKIESPVDGPVVLLTACMHGDETGGSVVIHELFRELKKNLLKGKLHAFPLLNPFGFENMSSRISISNEDLNRSFPGNIKGTLAQRIAAIVMKKIIDLKPDIVLDLHNDWNNSIPYAVIDAGIEQKTLITLHHFATVSDLPAVQETDKITTSFSYCVNMESIPALTLELGESMIINERNVIKGKEAILNILYDLGMTEKSTRTFNADLPSELQNKILMYSGKPLCSESGIIRFSKKPGDMVKKGDKIARVYNAFGKLLQTIVSVHDGIILGHNDYAVAYPGSQVMAFGVINPC